MDFSGSTTAWLRTRTRSCDGFSHRQLAAGVADSSSDPGCRRTSCRPRARVEPSTPLSPAGTVTREPGGEGKRRPRDELDARRADPPPLALHRRAQRRGRGERLLLLDGHEGDDRSGEGDGGPCVRAHHLVRPGSHDGEAAGREGLWRRWRGPAAAGGAAGAAARARTACPCRRRAPRRRARRRRRDGSIQPSRVASSPGAPRSRAPGLFCSGASGPGRRNVPAHPGRGECSRRASSVTACGARPRCGGRGRSRSAPRRRRRARRARGERTPARCRTRTPRARASP